MIRLITVILFVAKVKETRKQRDDKGDKLGNGHTAFFNLFD